MLSSGYNRRRILNPIAAAFLFCCSERTHDIYLLSSVQQWLMSGGESSHRFHYINELEASRLRPIFPSCTHTSCHVPTQTTKTKQDNCNSVAPDANNRGHKLWCINKTYALCMNIPDWLTRPPYFKCAPRLPGAPPKFLVPPPNL
jgi:hypothetical protein